MAAAAIYQAKPVKPTFSAHSCWQRSFSLTFPALAAAAATAATPVVTVQARIFKEDIFVAAFLVLAFAALIRLLQSPATHRAILLGVFAGLTAGSKYVGFLFLLFAIFAIIFLWTPGPPRKPWCGDRHLSACHAAGDRADERWHKRVKFEIRHAVEGTTYRCR